MEVLLFFLVIPEMSENIAGVQFLAFLQQLASLSLYAICTFLKFYEVCQCPWVFISFLKI